MVATPALAERATCLLVAVFAAGLVITRARIASGFELAGHEVIEAAAYKRLLDRTLVPGTGVSGRTLLAVLIADGVLYQPRCFDLAHPRGDCPSGGRLDLPLAYLPVLGSGAADLILDRQISEQGQCQHFMAETRDGLSAPNVRLGVPEGLVTRAFAHCALIAGVAFDRILRRPRMANWRLSGTYALIHGIEDSFSAAHVARDERGHVVHLLSWTLIDWPIYFWRGIFSFPPATHHAVHDARDLDYLRPGAVAVAGKRCDQLANPYAVPESCLTPRALQAVAAIEDLLIALYRLRAQAASEGQTATVASPEGATVWGDYLRAHLSSVEVTAQIPTVLDDGVPRPDVFVGAQVSARKGGWGLGLWSARLLLGPAVPFMLSVGLAAGYSRVDGGNSVGASAGMGLLLPLVRRFAIGATPAGLQAQCNTAFTSCTTEVIANVGNLIVPLGGLFWLGVEGPRWSWTARSFNATWIGVVFGWAHEDLPEIDPAARAAVSGWDPPRPADVGAFRRARATRLAFVTATAASRAENQFVGLGLTWRLDHDDWDQRSGAAFGVDVEVDHGVIDGNPNAGTVAIAPLFACYLIPNRVVITAYPALLRLGALSAAGFGADLAGRAGIAFDVGRVELTVDSPPLSYLSRERWHALPITVRLGLLF